MNKTFFLISFSLVFTTTVQASDCHQDKQAMTDSMRHKEYEYTLGIVNESGCLKEALKSLKNGTFKPITRMDRAFYLEAENFLRLTISTTKYKRKSANKLKMKRKSLHGTDGESYLMLISQTNKAKRLTSFDTPLTPKALDFFKRLGIDKIAPRSITDLSSGFPNEVPLQGSSLSCVGHAISSEMEFEIFKLTKKKQPISGFYTYQLLQRFTPNYWAKEYDLSLSYEENAAFDNKSGEFYQDSGLSHYDWYSVFSKSKFIEKTRDEYAGLPIGAFPGKKLPYKITHTEKIVWRLRTRTSPFNFEFFKILINNQMPPVVILSTDARKEFDDWYTPIIGKTYQHAAVIVGYGFGKDPEDGLNKDYFIMRDSFVDHPVHYKVAVENLIPIITEVHKITKIEEIQV